MNENLDKLVQLAQNKKATAFKALLHGEINTRLASKMADIKTKLSTTMFSKNVVEEDVKLKEGELPPALKAAIAKKKGKKVEDDDEDKDTKDEGTLPPALQKAIDAKKGKKKDDEDDDEVEENIANFGKKKAKPFKKD